MINEKKLKANLLQDKESIKIQMGIHACPGGPNRNKVGNAQKLIHPQCAEKPGNRHSMLLYNLVIATVELVNK